MNSHYVKEDDIQGENIFILIEWDRVLQILVSC